MDAYQEFLEAKRHNSLGEVVLTPFMGVGVKYIPRYRWDGKRLV